MHSESSKCNKQSVSIQHTQSTTPCNCNSESNNKNSSREMLLCTCDSKDVKPSCNCDVKDSGRPLCACDSKQLQTERTTCACDTKSPQRQTYSAQHQSKRPPCPDTQSFDKTTTCNTLPLYTIPLKRDTDCNTGNSQNYCPCSGLPPPPYPPTDDLWDLQFCRWWGWNWIRRREELMNKQKAEHKDFECQSCSRPETNRRNPYDKFLSWCCKKINGDIKPMTLKCQERSNLQELYDTPCSSIILGGENDWEGRSANVRCECEYCCNRSRHMSRSTIIMQNHTRKRAGKHNVRKHQSWICTKTDSSSSDDICPCCSLDPKQSIRSTTEDSIEYLSLRMERVKSECDNDEMEKKPHLCKNCRKASLNKRKRPDSCPCKVKQTHEKPHVCECHKHPKHKSHVHKDPDLTPCKSLPLCRVSPSPNKIPIFRRYLQPEKNRPPSGAKHKTCTCKCHKKQKEYKVCCTCETAKKKPKSAEGTPKVYLCCCCCCHQCGQGGAENKPEPKEQTPKETVDKSMNCPCDPNIGNTPLGVSLCNELSNFPAQNATFQKLMSTYNVSSALGSGLYSSPVTGRAFSLNPKTLVPDPIACQSAFPQPIDANDTRFLSHITPAKAADVEHRNLLQAVCNAIMSSHTSFNTNEKSSRPPHVLANSAQNDAKYLPSQRSREVAMHVYETDNTASSDAVIDLFKAKTQRQRKYSNITPNCAQEGTSKLVPQNNSNCEQLKKASYYSLKKIYNEKTFPFKRCTIGQNLATGEQSESADESPGPSTCGTERLGGIETASENSAVEDQARFTERLDIFSCYNSKPIVPPFLATSGITTPLQVESANTQNANENNKKPANFAEIQKMLAFSNKILSEPFSSFIGYSNLLDVSSRLPTIEEHQAPNGATGSIETKSMSSIETHAEELVNSEKLEANSRIKCMKRESPFAPFFSPNSSKILKKSGSKSKLNGPEKPGKKPGCSKTEKQLKCTEKRWKY